MVNSVYAVKSIIFELLRVGLTIAFTFIALASFPLSPITRYKIIRLWSWILIKISINFCGLEYKIIGKDNIPNKPTIILSNHQSAWETLAYQSIFPPQVWVLKKELLLIPFFGWGLAMTSPIAIDRQNKIKSLRQTIKQGKDRLKKGFCIVVFPEGTRANPMELKKFQIGGAFLACKTRTSVTPVAHNAGSLWGKNAVIKYPGQITVSVGPEIKTDGLSPEQLNQLAESWIAKELKKIGNAKTK